MLSGQAGWLGEETSIREGRSAQKGELWAACSEEMCRLFCIPFCERGDCPSLVPLPPLHGHTDL